MENFACARMDGLTISAFFEIVARAGVDAEIDSIPDVVGGAVADSGPFEDDLYWSATVLQASCEKRTHLRKVVGAHRCDAEP